MTAVYVLLAAAGLLLAAAAVYAFHLAYKHYHPYTRPNGKVNVHGMEYERVRIPSSRGVTLDGLLLPVRGATHAIVVAHELGTFKETKLRIARRLVSEGFSVLLFDLRNHGASGRDRSLAPMSELFTDDIEAALRFARERLREARTVTLYSFSLSTFASLYLANRPGPQPDNIVLDSGPILSVENNAGNFMDAYGKATLPRVVRLPFVYPVVKAFFEFFSLRMLATSWPPALANVKGRVLFIANGQDVLFPEVEIRRVAAAVPNGTVWVCPGSLHLQAHRSDPEGYERALLDFLRPPAASAGVGT